MERPDEHDDDYAAWPFRRQLVDPFARPDDPLPPPALPRVTPLPLVVEAPRRRPLRPLALALLLAATAFLAAFAVAAYTSEQPSTPRLVQVADAAAGQAPVTTRPRARRP